MRKRTGNRGVCLAVSVALLLLTFNGISAKQENKDEELKKKYGAILGDYEFDLTDLGGDSQILSFYVRDGNLWADSGDGRPAIMEPDEGEAFKFGATDPESGRFEITFLKDENGNYTKCRVYIEDLDVEILGVKIGKQLNYPGLCASRQALTSI